MHCPLLQTLLGVIHPSGHHNYSCLSSNLHNRKLFVIYALAFTGCVCGMVSTRANCGVSCWGFQSLASAMLPWSLDLSETIHDTKQSQMECSTRHCAYKDETAIPCRAETSKNEHLHVHSVQCPYLWPPVLCILGTTGIVGRQAS